LVSSWGATEEGEEPEAAAIRELEEECNVKGRVRRLLSHNDYSDRFQEYSYLADIGDQRPSIGVDPELDGDSQILKELRWLSLNEIPEFSRCYLWAAGLMGVEVFQQEILSWTNDISYPKRKRL
jgi:8-oxo-dGTP diphosphatase